MKNKRILTTLLALVALMCVFAAVFAACKENEEPKAKVNLTFSEGVGSDISTSVQQAEVGTKLKEVFGKITPKMVAGLNFGGWFKDGNPADPESEVPEIDCTFTARYLASYSVAVYTQGADGAYTLKTESGESYYGQPFTYNAAAIEHYTLGGKPDGDYPEVKTSSEQLGINEKFAVYYNLDSFTVTFFANPPAGADVSELRLTADVLYGGKVAAKSEADFALPDDYRLAGWAEKRNGEVVYGAEAELNVRGSVNLYAVWDTAKRDVNGGGDKLFLSSNPSEKGAVILRRQGIEEKKGVYNADSGVFAFTENDAVVLDGIALASEFYYFTDALNGVYRDFDGSQSTLKIEPHGAAVYTPAGGTAVTGTYSLNVDTGKYLFVPDSGNSVEFILQSDNGVLTFRTENAAQTGYYALSDGKGGVSYDLFYFDGIGGLKFIMEPETVNGEEEILSGFYLLTDSATNTYSVSIYSDSGILIVETAIRITTKAYELGDYDIKGAYTLADDYRGKFKIGDYQVLELDGFGKGSFGYTSNPAQGTYTIEHTQSWYAASDSNVYEVAEYWIKFTASNGQSTLFYFDEDLYGRLTASVCTDVKLYRFENALYNNGSYYNNGATKAFLYKYTVQEGWTDATHASLWIGSYDSGLKDWVYSQYDEGRVYTLGDNDYRFTGIGLIAEFEFEFYITADETVHFNGVDVVLFDDESGKLYIDTDGLAQFVGADGDKSQVEMAVEDGLIYVYTFTVNGVTRSFYFETDGVGTRTAVEIGKDDVYDVGYLAESRRNTYIGRIIIVRGSEEDNAVIGLRLEDESGYFYCYFGTFAPVAGAEGEYYYTTTASAFAENEHTDVMAEYGNFRLKLDKDNKLFYQFDVQLDIECDAGRLTTDGYGSAAYSANGINVTGEYDIQGNIVRITVSESEQYVLRITKDGDEQSGGEFEAVQTVGEEQGFYYTIDDNGNLDNHYFFLDGVNGVLLYNGSSALRGTYERTQNNEYKEFRLLIDGGLEGELEYYVATAFIDEVGLNIYLIKDDTQAGRYDVEGSSSSYLYGDGYLDAIYVSANEFYNGVMQRGTLTDDDYASSRGWQADANGKNIMFAAYDDDDNLIAQFIFDLTENGVAVLRELAYGSYSGRANGEDTGEEIYLDGHGKATYVNAQGKTVGEYRAVDEPGTNVFRFTDGDKLDFLFELYKVNGVFAFTVYDNESAGTFLGDNWTALILDGFVEATYVNGYGVTVSGEYVFLADDLVRVTPFEYQYDVMYFEIDGSHSRLYTEDWIITDGALYLFTGVVNSSNRTLKIPDGVTRILAGAFKNADMDYLEELDLNDVEVIEDRVFYSTSLSVVRSSKLREIGKGAFENNTVLHTLDIPNVAVIGENAFRGCSSLINVKLGAVKSIGAHAFTASATGTLQLDLSGVTDFNGIAIDASSFVISGEGATENRNMVTLVSSVAALNSLYASKLPQSFKETAIIANQAKGWDDVDFISFANGNVYSFADGEVTRYVSNDGVYESEFFASYYVDSNGSAVVYSYSDDAWKVLNTVTAAQGVTELGGDKLFKEEVSISLSVQGTDKLLTVELYVWIYNGSLMLNVESLAYGGEQSVNPEIGDDFVIGFTLADGDYTATYGAENWIVAKVS